MKPLAPTDIEIKPGMSRSKVSFLLVEKDMPAHKGRSDGLIYLPEIKYRKTLNMAFGPGGWGLAPRGETNVGPRIVSREWGLVCLGRYGSSSPRIKCLG